MKITTVSDTHGFHFGVERWIIDCAPRSPDEKSLIIHAGDCTSLGTEAQFEQFCDWYGQLPFTYKVLTPGNHDLVAEKMPGFVKEVAEKRGIIYLDNSGCTVEGIKIWGSPFTPIYGRWAFMKPRDQMASVWEQIPDDTEILVTHGPAHRILDKVKEGQRVGCEALAARIEELKTKSLRYHICGHIHEAHGMWARGDVSFINASICNLYLVPVNIPPYSFFFSK